ncbi:hypothetical protein D1AOALGA4SA_10963 [Olavius algarvensis Delta 1 endosymbiont]|nr:hypothetical protein D1AOALGA4SA_10963 [Olavius algarvensis Delta 1 endosymbiont]
MGGEYIQNLHLHMHPDSISMASGVIICDFGLRIAGAERRGHGAEGMAQRVKDRGLRTED